MNTCPLSCSPDQNDLARCSSGAAYNLGRRLKSLTGLTPYVHLQSMGFTA